MHRQREERPTEPSRPAERSPRAHEIDALRSSLMLLGVVLHAAAPFSASMDWIVRAPEGHPFFDVLTTVIHLFRMPAFFVVAGYFASLVLRRRGQGPFLRDRALRLGVPLVGTLLTANLLEVWVLARTGALDGAGGLAATYADAWAGGDWLGHLWFLVHALAFCGLLAATSRPLDAVAARVLSRGGEVSMPRLVGACVAAGGAVGLASAAGLSPGVLGGLVDPLELASYAPFFAAGVFLEREPTALARFSQPGWRSYLAGGLALAVASASNGRGGAAGLVALHLALPALQWALVRAAFHLFHAVAARPSPAFRYLADASYSVYLLHHVVVVAAASALVGTSAGPWLSFAALLVLGSALPLAVHHLLILPSPRLTLLFNGRRVPAREAARLRVPAL